MAAATLSSMLPYKSARWIHLLPQWTSILCLAVILLGSALLRHRSYARSRSHKNASTPEPPDLPWNVPLVGHLLGLMAKQVGHFHDVGNNTVAPAASLPVLFGKMYVIFEPALIQSALRSPSLSFEPVMMQYAQGLLGLDAHTMHAVRNGLLADLLRASKPAFASEQLARHNLAALDSYAHVLNRIQPESPLHLSSLYTWLQHVVTVATAEILYGVGNPLTPGSGLIDDVWALEGGLRKLILSFVPSITARRPYRARERLIQALAPLFETAAEDSLPGLSRSRASMIREHGIVDPEDIARCEVSLLHVATVNTVPILFWMVVNIFSRPQLVEALRSELSCLLRHGREGGGEDDDVDDEDDDHDDGDDDGRGTSEQGIEIHLSIGTLQRSCPLLKCCLQECLRIYGQPLHSRRVLSDTMLADGKGDHHLFRGGVDVMMPSGVSHRVPRVWGPDADGFRPALRFMDWPECASREQRAAYMPFGGGRHLCPGRDFATGEVLGFVAALILGMQVEGVTSATTVRVPGLTPPLLGQAVAKPKGLETGDGLEVRIRRREGFGRVTWCFAR